MPKRLGHILEKVADFNNIELADIKSITERSKYYEVNFIMDNHAYFTRTNNKKLIKLMY